MTIVIGGATRGGRHVPQRPLPEAGGDEERDGTRRLREAPFGKEGCDGARNAASNRELKQTERRTVPLAVR